jgi:hypothetical protein
LALKNRIFFPLDDTDIEVSDEDAAVLMNDLKMAEGQANFETYNTDFNMSTDESFSRIFFYGMGSALIAAQEEVSDSEYGPFVVDMPLQDLECRSKYRPYGARIHFSEDQKATAIYDYGEEKLVKAGEEGWDAAKCLAKMTAFTLLTAREHLMWAHFIVSNTITRETTLCFPPSHPIRRLMTIFTFGGTDVNIRAFDQLVPDTGLLHRSMGFKYHAIQDLFDMAYTTCNLSKNLKMMASSLMQRRVQNTLRLCVLSFATGLRRQVTLPPIHKPRHSMRL